MKRDEFLVAASASVIALGAGSTSTAAAAHELQLGEARRFPGYVLKAFADHEGEVYLAYSADALSKDLIGELGDVPELVVSSYRAQRLRELEADTIISNADGPQMEESCDGRCASRGVDSHECFVVRDKIEEWVRGIDSGDVERDREALNAEHARYRREEFTDADRIRFPELAADPYHGLQPFHPGTEGMVDQLWTSYR